MEFTLKIRDEGGTEEYALAVDTLGSLWADAEMAAEEHIQKVYFGEEPGAVTYSNWLALPVDFALDELAEFLGDTPLAKFLADYLGDDNERGGGTDIITPEPDCPEADAHDWTSEFEGGCDKNPGVWDTGGGNMLFVSRCRHCGMERRRVSLYAVGNSNRCAGVPDESMEYSEPDSAWLAEFISED